MRIWKNRELLRGQCYDGCSTRMGKVSGVAQIIKQGISHWGLAVYYFCHSLSLACSYIIKNCTLMKNSLSSSFEITKLVKFSSKQEPHLKEIIAKDMSTEYVEVLVKQEGQFVQKVYRVFFILQKPKEPVGLVFIRIWRNWHKS